MTKSPNHLPNASPSACTSGRSPYCAKVKIESRITLILRLVFSLSHFFASPSYANRRLLTDALCAILAMAICTPFVSAQPAPSGKAMAAAAHEAQLRALYNPPAPERYFGGYSGTIGSDWYSSELGWLNNIHESGNSNPKRALQLNQAGCR